MAAPAPPAPTASAAPATSAAIFCRAVHIGPRRNGSAASVGGMPQCGGPAAPAPAPVPAPAAGIAGQPSGSCHAPCGRCPCASACGCACCRPGGVRTGCSAAPACPAAAGCSGAPCRSDPATCRSQPCCCGSSGLPASMCTPSSRRRIRICAEGLEPTWIRPESVLDKAGVKKPRPRGRAACRPLGRGGGEEWPGRGDPVPVRTGARPVPTTQAHVPERSLNPPPALPEDPVRPHRAGSPRRRRDDGSGRHLEITRRDGLDALTIRALAADLGVSRMALYRHVSGKDELVALVMDAIAAHDIVPAGLGARGRPRRTAPAERRRAPPPRDHHRRGVRHRTRHAHPRRRGGGRGPGPRMRECSAHLQGTFRFGWEPRRRPWRESVSVVERTANAAANAGVRAPEATLLVVEDEPNILELLAGSLRFTGFEVLTATNGADAVQSARRHRPDLIVLDVMLPDIDGFDVARRLRSGGDHTPVLFLTARDAVQDRIKGLTIGGDDYVTKPFSLEEVIARIRAVLRRFRGGVAEPPPRMVFADVELDEDSHEVWRGGKAVQLSPTEFKLLRYFMANAGRVLSKAQILDHVWNYDFRGDAGIVESYVSALRRKVDNAEPRLIHTLRGVGYVLREPPA
ncbi:response regulator [Actinomadura sp. LD22]|uniref:Response regulator n=1 Tax=Actinomadura physcomitrii TaxID=2650748 RepID=A0A6I4MLX1_9ACTN|nr:response regulator [Actinomadura physcomitrii]